MRVRGIKYESHSQKSATYGATSDRQTKMKKQVGSYVNLDAVETFSGVETFT